ncbi:hypothetical protein GGX14DRAFT_399109 [Mycena pura]|uniref:Uncharacterized protein n=1 Tax=Mycena pura TaxID=153505 RepID=A0AAD6V5B6_9AGAR|nr:hypothetical protein GGX14DRAFT_399109 [Mycena pura]
MPTAREDDISSMKENRRTRTRNRPKATSTVPQRHVVPLWVTGTPTPTNAPGTAFVPSAGVRVRPHYAARCKLAMAYNAVFLTAKVTRAVSATLETWAAVTLVVDCVFGTLFESEPTPVGGKLKISQLDSEEGGFGLVVSQRARQSILVPGRELLNPPVARPLQEGEEVLDGE